MNYFWPIYFIKCDLFSANILSEPCDIFLASGLSKLTSFWQIYFMICDVLLASILSKQCNILANILSELFYEQYSLFVGQCADYMSQVDHPCPLLLDMTGTRGRSWGVSSTKSSLPHTLQHRPIFSSAMSWRQPSWGQSVPSTETHVNTATYIKRPPNHCKPYRTGDRVPRRVLRSNIGRHTEHNSNPP